MYESGINCSQFSFAVQFITALESCADVQSFYLFSFFTLVEHFVRKSDYHLLEGLKPTGPHTANFFHAVQSMTHCSTHSWFTYDLP